MVKSFGFDGKLIETTTASSTPTDDLERYSYKWNEPRPTPPSFGDEDLLPSHRAW